MGSTPALCEEYCQEYGDYLYCISGAISWGQCLTGNVDSPPTYGYPYFSPPTFIDESEADSGIKKNKTGLIAAAVAGGIAGTAIFFLLGLLLCCYCRRLHPRPRKGAASKKSLPNDGSNSNDPTPNSKALTIGRLDALAASQETVAHGDGKASVSPETGPRKPARFVSLNEVRTATSTTNYSRKHLIGEGRFGSVYYGRLVTGEEVAVKVNSYKAHQSAQDFLNEVSLLSGLHHPNVVSLVGFCDECQNRMLIFEFMPKKTLRHHLYGLGSREPLDWKTRLQVAIHAARGLEYLHQQQPAMVHGDIKSSNILLTDQFAAKVADLDISKLLPEATSPKLDNHEYFPAYNASSRLLYYDPEFRSLSTKSDVYAFGVVLLEIICGKPPRDVVRYSTIVTWARDIIQAGSVEKLADPTLAGTYNVEVLRKVAELTMSCVEPQSIHRPDMSQVALRLTDALDLQNAAVQKLSVTSAASPPASDSAAPLPDERGLSPSQ